MSLWVPSLIYPLFPPFLVDVAIQNQVQLQMAATIAPPPLAASRSEEMAIMGHVGIPINDDDIMQSQLLMDSMLADNVLETVPFGEVNS